MRVELRDISRHFGQQLVFKNINYTFEEGEKHAILGGNGSGKSTLIKIIYGSLSISRGEISRYENGNSVLEDKSPFRSALAAPYFELIEELTAIEFLNFYKKFRPFASGMDSEAVLEKAMLAQAAEKEIRNFSSGMKQRLRLALAIFSEASLLLLDEPTSNLDPQGIKWYQNLIAENTNGRTVIVGSNFNEQEMGSCTNMLKIEEYK